MLEALAGIASELPWGRERLLESLQDPDGRVCANAAIGLYRMGAQVPALARLTEMAGSKNPAIRCSAAWAIGQIPNEKLFDALNRLRADSESRVKWHALRSLANFNRAGVKPTQAVPSVEVPEETSVELTTAPEPPRPPVHIPEARGFTTRTFGRLI